MSLIPGSIATIIESQEKRKQEEGKIEEGSRAWEGQGQGQGEREGYSEPGHRWGIRCRLHSVRIVRAVSRTVRSTLEKVRLRVQTKGQRNRKERTARKGRRGDEAQRNLSHDGVSIVWQIVAGIHAKGGAGW